MLLSASDSDEEEAPTPFRVLPSFLTAHDKPKSDKESNTERCDNLDDGQVQKKTPLKYVNQDLKIKVKLARKHRPLTLGKRKFSDERNTVSPTTGKRFKQDSPTHKENTNWCSKQDNFLQNEVFRSPDKLKHRESSKRISEDSEKTSSFVLHAEKRRQHTKVSETAAEFRPRFGQLSLTKKLSTQTKVIETPAEIKPRFSQLSLTKRQPHLHQESLRNENLNNLNRSELNNKHCTQQGGVITQNIFGVPEENNSYQSELQFCKKRSFPGLTLGGKRRPLPPFNNNNNSTMSVYDYSHQQSSSENGTSSGSLVSSNNFGSKHTNSSNHIDDVSLTNNSNHNNFLANSSAASMATLCNIGNTCYLNSVVYTLRFAPMFLHNLHHLIEDLLQINQKLGQNKAKSSSLGRNIGGFQGANARSWSSKDLASLGTNSHNSQSNNCDVPKSNRQIATEKLHELYQNLHRNELIESSEPFHADIFLHAIQDVSSIFEGNQQQDAHEFLMCILDSIRETCIQLMKIVSEQPEMIHANGYVSVPEQIETPPPPQSTTAPLKTFFSRKSKRKEDKIKSATSLRQDSPAKDVTSNDTTDSSAGLTKNFGLLGPITTIDEGSVGNGVLVTKDCNNKEAKIREKIKKLGLDFVTEDFEGITVSTTKCLSCETVTEQKETMIDIAVPISGNENMETMEKPHLFFQNSCITREHFCGENKYRCEQCFGYTEAIRSISFEVLPRLLIIQLKRFSGGMEKINSYIPTPFVLDCFCSKCSALPESEKPHVYKLYSVITHVGATMSVGHYIAYTCSLDFHKDYVNCPKDKRKPTLSGTAPSSSTSSSSSSIVEKNTGIMKKIMFGRNKASSSGDVTKNIKNLNDFMIKTLTNGVDKSHSNQQQSAATTTPAVPVHTCPGLNCCGIHMKQPPTNYSNGGSANNHIVNGNGHHALYNGYVDLGSNDHPSSYSASALLNSHAASQQSAAVGNGVKTSPVVDPIWYMCDDDKIKAMSQREFEELLSPNRKIMITPYLLFYARTDVQ